MSKTTIRKEKKVSRVVGKKAGYGVVGKAKAGSNLFGVRQEKARGKAKSLGTQAVEKYRSATNELSQSESDALLVKALRSVFE
jgi:hypothetical protein